MFPRYSILFTVKHDPTHPLSPPLPQLTGWAVAKAFHYKFDTYAKIPQFRGCLFFYVGGRDTIIPAWRGWRLFNNAIGADSRCKYSIEDEKADHCGMPGSPFDNPKVSAVFDQWAAAQ